jgi:quercetin dioxygenase-like cupin family protein
LKDGFGADVMRCDACQSEIPVDANKRIKQHGMAGAPEYAIWQAMRQRCENPRSQSWLNYGGRGIKVCAEWTRFEKFYADMGVCSALICCCAGRRRKGRELARAVLIKVPHPSTYVNVVAANQRAYHDPWNITIEGTIMAQADTMIPADDPARKFTLARSDDPKLPHIGLVGDTYTILVAGKDTDGRYSLIDMHIPPGGGPPPHRHDFEEMFSILEGEIEATFRGKKTIIRAGETINIPANAPHQFQNKSGKPARLLCLCSPAGQEEFFREVGVPVATRTTPPPRSCGRAR